MLKQMFRLFAVLSLALFFQIEARAYDIISNHSGSWYNPNQSGHGLSVEVLPDGRTAIFWYVYDSEGSPTFLVAVGQNQGNRVVATASIQEGMRFGEFNPNDIQRETWGTITLTFNSCTSATLQYDSVLAEYGSGTIPMERLLEIDDLECAEPPEAGIYHGTFNQNGRITAGFILLTESREFMAISFDEIAAVGTYTVNNGSVTGSGIAVTTNLDVAPFSGPVNVSGSIAPNYRGVFSFEVPGLPSGTGDFYSAGNLFRRETSLAQIAGNYNAHNLVNGAQGQASIDGNGRLTGSDGNGCDYNGQFSLPNRKFNYLKLRVTVSSCGPLNGTYSGYGTTEDWFTLGDGEALIVAASDGTRAAVIGLFP